MAFVHTLASCRITPPSWRIRFSLLQRRVLTRAREEFLADSCSQRLESRFRREIFARRNLEEKGPLRSLTKFSIRLIQFFVLNYHANFGIVEKLIVDQKKIERELSMNLDKLVEQDNLLRREH